ncbi:MAG: hypothetical protein K2I42_07500 [Anaeroplasmataceae bacterium]|nr:hypothetical protein [Anaeroplasmataceae bacterium]
MKLEIILSFLGTCIGFGISLVTLVFKLLKNKKARESAEQSIDIMNNLQSFMIDAEQYIHYSNEEKKQYVLTRMKQIMVERQIPFEDKILQQKLEELITFSKQVNKKTVEEEWL